MRACIENYIDLSLAQGKIDLPTSPGELIHADVCRPVLKKSLDGNRYFVAFKDDFSQYRTVQRKTEAVITKFAAKVKTAGYTLKELWTNGGREFNNSEVHSIVQKAGLNHQTFMPYTTE